MKLIHPLSARALILYLFTAQSLFALPVIPGLKGFGIETPGGRGGKIIHVTNLNADGEGSLNAAIQASGPRIVVFDVGGVIKISKVLKLTNPFITIAGQTAPYPGITICGTVLHVFTHDIVLQHIAIRPGDAKGPRGDIRDCLRLEGHVYNLVVDHCSFSWGIDGNFGMWQGYDRKTTNPHDLAFSNILSAEPLNCSIHSEDCHGKGIVINEFCKRVALVNVIQTNSPDRNPLSRGGSETVICNMAVYNPGYTGHDAWEGTYYSGYQPMKESIVSMTLIAGPNTRLGAFGEMFMRFSADNRTKIYLGRNRADAGFSLYNLDQEISYVATPEEAIWISGLESLPVDDVQSGALFDLVGMRPGDREDVDRRIIHELRMHQLRHIDSQKDVGGYPAYTKTSHELDIPANPNGDDDKDGYTNVEEWLHEKARNMEQIAPAKTTPKPPSNLTIATISSTIAMLKWEHNADNDDGYLIERKKGNGPWVIAGKIGRGRTHFLDYSVRPTESYTYRVSAFNEAGNSSSSHEAMIDGPAAEPRGFVEKNGLIVMEGENFTDSSRNNDNAYRTWEIESTFSGFSGDGYVRVFEGGDVFWTQGCEITYKINVLTTGCYRMWLRRRISNGGGEAVYMGIDGRAAGGMDNVRDDYNNWAWYFLGPVYLDHPGEHVLHIRRKEKNYQIDRVLLTTDAAYRPEGIGPAESERRGTQDIPFEVQQSNNIQLQTSRSALGKLSLYDIRGRRLRTARSISPANLKTVSATYGIIVCENADSRIQGRTLIVGIDRKRHLR